MSTSTFQTFQCVNCNAKVHPELFARASASADIARIFYPFFASLLLKAQCQWALKQWVGPILAFTLQTQALRVNGP